ncbi:MAG: AI-2E family transporter [Halobacteriaceae archaeon]
MAFPYEMSRARAAWWAAGTALLLALAHVVYSFVGTFVFGVFIYYATRPVHRRLDRHVRYRSLSAALSLFLLALPALLLVAYTLAIGLQEFEKVATQVDVGRLEDVLRPYIDLASIAKDPEQLLDQPDLMSALQAVLRDALGYLGFVGTALLHLFVMITIAFYLLRDDRRLARWFRTRFVTDDSPLQAYTVAVDRDFNNIFFGNILNAALTAVIGAISYNALAMAAPPGVRIPYPTLLGLLTGVASLVPVIGMKLVYFPMTAYIFYLVRTDVQLLWFPVTFAVVSFVVVDVIPDLVLRPYVSGRGLHLGMVMLAYIFGPLLWGWYGIFLGPMLLVLVVHFTRLVLPELLLGRPIRPEVVDPDLLDGRPTSASGGGTAPDGESDDRRSGDTGGGAASGAGEETDRDGHAGSPGDQGEDGSDDGAERSDDGLDGPDDGAERSDDGDGSDGSDGLPST